MVKEAGDKALLFMLYTTLYSNDMVCNSIKDLERYVRDKDKETQKIYGALHKRVGEYFKKTNKILNESSYFLADFSAYLDDYVDDALFNLRSFIYSNYVDAGIDDAEYLSCLEMTRSMCAISCEHIDGIQKQLVKENLLPHRFEYGNMTDMFRILNNLCLWSYRKIDKNIMVDFNKEELGNKINEVMSGIFSFERFNAAYSYAQNLEKERKANGK